MKSTKLKNFLKLISVGAVAGAVNGFFGAGGGLLIVPMLKKYGINDSKEVHATTLACVLFMCICSAIVYLIKGKIDFCITLWCLLGSVVGGIVGTIFLKKLKNRYIDLIFSIILIVAGIGIVIF